MANVDDLAINTHADSVRNESARTWTQTIWVFSRGTIEEYIDSRTLTSEESADPEISKDIALSLAAAHAIK